MDRPAVLDIGYYDPAQVYSSTLGPQFQKRIRLHTLHWRYRPTDPIKTINHVELHYVDDARGVGSDNEFLKFIFVTCSNVDEYRSRVRPLIRQWLNNVKSLTPRPTYYIILYENVSLRSAADKFLKTSLLTKIRTDFADDELTIENAFRIKSSYSDADTEKEVWDSILNNVRLGLLDSISAKLQYYGSYRPPLAGLRRSADLYKQIGQYDDALKCYHTILTHIGDIHAGDGFEDLAYAEFPWLSHRRQLVPYAHKGESLFTLKCNVYRQQQDILGDEAVQSAAVYMKNRAQLAVSLLRLLRSIYDCPKRYVFSVVLIEDFFASEKLEGLLTGGEEEIPPQFYEQLGDLRIQQRDELIRLGKVQGYHMKGSMEEVALSPESLESSQTVQIEDSHLSSVLGSQKKFTASILEISEDCIRLYSASPYRANTVDALSTEVALMVYYDLQDYNASLEVLKNSFEYYKSAGWTVLAARLWKIYMENLEKVEDGSQLDSSLLSSYLEMISTGQQFQTSRLQSLLSGLTEPMVVENNDLFDVIVDPCVRCDACDEYYLDVEVRSKLADVTAETVVLTLEKEETQIVLKGKEVALSAVTSVKVHSSNFIMGTFSPSRMSIHVGKLELVCQLADQPPITFFQIGQFVRSAEIVNNTVLDAVIPPSRRLYKDQLLLSAKLGDTTLTQFQFEFFKTDTDRLVPDAKYEMETDGAAVDFEVEDTDDKMVFSVKDHTLSAGSTVTLYFPYFFPPDVSDTKLNIEFAFSSPAKFSKRVYKQLSSSLQIAVSVQDIFKTSKLFSNYTINSVSAENPVRLQSVDLVPPKGEGHTTVKTWQSPENVVAFMDQGSTFFYMLEHLQDESLDLTINYNDLHSEIVDVLSLSYLAELTQSLSPLIRYYHLVSTRIFEKLHFKLNLFGVMRRVELLEYDISNYTDSLKLVDKHDLPVLIRSVSSHLDKYNHKALPLDTSVLERIRRTLVINVSLPVVNIVDVVEFQFQKQLQYLVCAPIKMTLKFDVFILHLQNEADKTVRFESDSDKPKQVSLRLEFTDYEQNWLIAGHKDFNVHLGLESESKSPKNMLQAELVLIPLKTGKLELPKVDIRNMSQFKVEMEIDYRNGSESLLVVSELNKVVHSF